MKGADEDASAGSAQRQRLQAGEHQRQKVRSSAARAAASLVVAFDLFPLFVRIGDLQEI